MDFSCVRKLRSRNLGLRKIAGAYEMHLKIGGKFKYLANYVDPECLLNQKKAYDIDLRWRVVYQRIGMNLTYENIATNLNIAVSTAYSIFMRFQLTGEVHPIQNKQRREIRKLDVHKELYTIGMVLDRPSMYLSEVCYKLEEASGVVVTPPTICRLLRTYGITRKKIQQVAL